MISKTKTKQQICFVMRPIQWSGGDAIFSREVETDVAVCRFFHRSTYAVNASSLMAAKRRTVAKPPARILYGEK
jgi:hypothetical protein